MSAQESFLCSGKWAKPALEVSPTPTGPRSLEELQAERFRLLLRVQVLEREISVLTSKLAAK